jgi:hypothetical protein
MPRATVAKDAKYSDGTANFNNYMMHVVIASTLSLHIPQTEINKVKLAPLIS